MSFSLRATCLAGPLTGLVLAHSPAALSQTAAQLKPWTVHDIYHPPANRPEPPAQTEWSPGGKILSYRTPDGSLGAIEAATGKRSILTPASKLRDVAKRAVDEQDRDHRARYAQPGYFWSPNGSQVLFDEDGTLWLNTLKNGTVEKIGDTGQGSGDDVKFSPDGKQLSFVHDHNLYVQQAAPGSTSVALTHTSDPNLRNGEVDWVYLEELNVRSNYAWSPDSRDIAYVQMDETKVPTFPLTDWIPLHATVDEQKYPQPGDPNPAVRVGVVAASGGPTRWIALPDVRPNQDYIPRLGWLDAHTVWVETLRRDHQHQDIWFADQETGAVTHALALTEPKFFDDNQYDVSVPAPGHLLLLSWRSGYTHIDHYTWSTTDPMRGGLKLAGQLENGDYDVHKVLSADANTVYYVSNEGDPLSSELWRVGLDGSGKTQVTSGPGDHGIVMAKGGEGFLNEHSDLHTPPTLDLCTTSAACRELWKDHSEDGHMYQAPEVLQLKAADGKTTLYATLLLPQDKSAAASVPLINNPYGGPGAQTVTRSWGSSWDQLLAQHGFAVLHVDNRGMSGRSRAFAQACYHDFGKVQLADQLAAIDQVLAKYPQLDPHRLGWWGWSWGGTFTLNALTHSDRFRAGISVAPVTDFRLYDSIYTERYLGLPVAEAGEPSDAPAYDAAAVQNSAGHLHGHLLLAFGTGDDNVHPSNEVQFVQKLIDANEPYDLQIFPRKTHSIAGPPARIELYERMLREWEQYLMPREAPAPAQ